MEYDAEYEKMMNEADDFVNDMTPEEYARFNRMRNVGSVLCLSGAIPEGMYMFTLNGNRSPEAQTICDFKAYCKWVSANIEYIVDFRKGYVEMFNGNDRVEVNILGVG